MRFLNPNDGCPWHVLKAASFVSMALHGLFRDAANPMFVFSCTIFLYAEINLTRLYLDRD